MTIETEVTRDTAHFVTREPRSSFASLLHELFFVNDTAKVTPFANVHELARLDDHYTQSAYSLLHELAYLDDLSFPALRYIVVTRDRFRADDAISAVNHAVVVVHEVARLNDYTVAPPRGVLHETAQLGDRLSWFSTGTQALREVAKLKDAAYPHVAVVLHEVAQLDDTISRHVRNVIVLREVGQLGDAVYPHRIARGTDGALRDVFYASDRASVRVLWSGRGALLHEIFYADDRALPPPSGRAFTCSIVSWGMSSYANFPFLTQAGNYAAGQNLWRLDATTDYGLPIQSWILTGRVDLGTTHGKRPSALYAAGSCSEPLALTVYGDVGGALKSFDYTLDLRDQTNYRNNRAILGKGFRSRYLQFKLLAGKYTALRLLNAEVDIAASQRRVG
jgi:hypothetical protein